MENRILRFQNIKLISLCLIKTKSFPLPQAIVCQIKYRNIFGENKYNYEEKLV